MIGAMVILLGLVIAFVVLRDLNRNDPPDPVRAVDYRRSAAYASERAGFDVLAPRSLPEGWKATTARFTPEPGRWHLGVLTDAGRYVGLEQAPGPVRSMVDRYVDPGATRGEAVTVEGRNWRAWSDDGGDTALVSREDGITTLVVGTVGQDVLVDYVRSLR
jgi:hypothetical protein